jgi:hypothetical protein
MEKEVSAPGGFSGPTSFEFVARGLLKTGKLPPIPFQPFSNRFQERFEGKEGLRATHDY